MRIEKSFASRVMSDIRILEEYIAKYGKEEILKLYQENGNVKDIGVILLSKSNDNKHLK